MHKDGQTNIIAHGQSRKGSFRGDIYLGLSTNEVDSHYNWLKKTSTPVIDSVQQGNDTVVQRFSPETIRPNPKAPPRKQAANRQKKRKTAILTDTPEKSEIERQSHAKKSDKCLKHHDLSWGSRSVNQSPSPNTGTESRKMMTHQTMSGIV